MFKDFTRRTASFAYIMPVSRLVGVETPVPTMLHNSAALRKFASEQKEKMNKKVLDARLSKQAEKEIFCFSSLHAVIPS